MKSGWKKPLPLPNEEQLTSSITQIKADQWVHYLLVSLLLILIAFSIVNVFWPQLFWDYFEIVDYIR